MALSRSMRAGDGSNGISTLHGCPGKLSGGLDLEDPGRCQASSPPTVARKVMNLQDFVKYLMCVLPACIGSLDFSNARDNEARQSRGVLDILIGRFKPCGGCQCGRSNKVGRFLGGEFADSHEFPWLVNIYITSNTPVIIVTGALINDRYVLTAATPLMNSTATEIKANLGEHDRCHPGTSEVTTSIEALILHPEFDFSSKANDLALLRLARPTKFEKRISPVCLPNPGSDYLGQVGTLTGWTENQRNNVDLRTCKPRKLGLPILGRKECLKTGSSYSLNPDFGCAGIIGSQNIVCPNDVGSAVLYRSYYGVYDLIGIIPDVNNCNGTNGTAMYVKVGPHLDWILQHTKDACFCTK